MLDRTIAPPSNHIERPVFPETEEIFINNIPVTVLNQGSQPVTLLEFVIPIGRWQEPSPGITYFLFKMITEGTKDKTSSEIASFLDFYGSHLEITPTLDNVSIKLYSLNKFLSKIFPLFISLFTDSVFPENEFKTIKQIRSQQLKQQLARNNVFASMKFRQMIFGDNHPYGYMLTSEDVENTTLDSLQSFKHTLLTKPKIFISGYVDQEVISVLSESLHKVNFSETIESIDSSINGVKSEIIKRDDSTQASIRIGKITIDKNHGDIHQLKVANTLFGGFFGSRLMKNIREDKGLTYGIHSSIINLEKYSYWSISSEIQKDKTELAKAEILKELDSLVQKPPRLEEMEMVKNYTRGKFLSSFDSPFSSHEMIKGLQLTGLDTNYLHNFLNTLDEITPGDISKMIGKHFRDDLTDLVVY